MKYMRKSLFVILLLVLTTMLLADKDKVGYIDSAEIMKLSKDAQEAQTIFENDQRAWKQQADDIRKEVTDLKDEYERKKYMMLDQGKEEALKKITEKETELEQFLQSIFGSNGKAAQRNEELLEPIHNKLRDAIKTVADDNGFSIILDLSSGAIVYAIPGINVTDQVVAEMDISTGDEQDIEFETDSKFNQPSESTPYAPPSTNPYESKPGDRE
ncbi:MAG: OmpH family outer membrane protein [Candidatus Cloacimonetes bacterium]|nr:OmpH family outer membrane protein [Candidatus Cloacimonadota bacterium]